MADTWDDFPVADEGSEWEEFPVADQTPAPQEPQQAQQPSWRSRAEEVWNRIRGVSAGDAAIGGGETAMQLGSAAAATPLAGYTGMLAPMTGYQRFLPEGVQEPSRADLVNEVQSGLTYQPRTEQGQAVSRGLAAPFQWYDEQVKDLAYAAGDEDDTLGAAAAYTAMAGFPAAMGVRGARGKGKTVSRRADDVPTTDQLRSRAQELYRAADNEGIGVKAGSYDAFLKQLEKRLADEGIDATLHPDSLAAFRAMQNQKGNNISLKGLEIDRKRIGAAAGSQKAPDARIARIMRDELDEYMGRLGDKDVIGGSDATNATQMIREARGLWSRLSKAEVLEEAVRRAGVRAGQYSGSGFENALRTEFRQIAMNKKRLRQFSPEEQKAIEMLASGTPLQNVARYIGKFAPRGVVSTSLGGITGGMLGGPAGAAFIWGAGEAGRQAATALQRRNLDRATELVRRGPREGGQ